MRIPFLGNKAGPAVADQRPPASNNEEEEYSSEGQDLSRKSSAHTPAGSLRSMPSATKLSKEERSITKSKVYHLSDVDDSGSFLPPTSPDKSLASIFSAKRSRSSRYDTYSQDQFTISRESFDSYRRSIDFSSHSPVTSQQHSRTASVGDSGNYPDSSQFKIHAHHFDQLNASEQRQVNGRNDNDNSNNFTTIQLDAEPAKDKEKRRALLDRIGLGSLRPSTSTATTTSTRKRSKSGSTENELDVL